MDYLGVFFKYSSQVGKTLSSQNLVKSVSIQKINVTLIYNKR